MTDKPNAIHSLGVELRGAVLHAAKLGLKKGKPLLEYLFKVTLSSETSLSSDEALTSSLEKDLVVTCLDSSEILIRQLEVKLKKESDIEAVLAFQAEPLLPYPIENAVLDQVKISDTAEGSLLTLCAVRKDHLQSHLEQWHSLKIEPEVTSCTPVALAAFVHHFAPETTSLLTLHIGLKETFCLLTKQGKLHAAQSCSHGTDTLEDAFKQDQEKFPSPNIENLKSFNFIEIDKKAYPKLAEVVEEMSLGITRTLYALSKQAKGEEISGILVTGEGSNWSHLSSFLCQSFQKPVLAPITDPQFELSTKELQTQAIPIGAALTALPYYKGQINFRQGDVAYPHPWRRYKGILSAYAAACLCLAISFYFLSTAYIKYREDQLRQRYVALVESMHRPYREVEREFLAKISGKKEVNLSEVPDIKSLTQSDITNRLNYLQSSIESSPYYYPLLPNVPTVSDILAWLSTHPNVTTQDPKTGSTKPLLQIENFNYSLVKRPDQTKKQERYQVKVEIDFSSPTPKLAREFHDALIAPNAFVDPKGEVKWNTNRGLYHASFFLKDRTAYPSS